MVARGEIWLARLDPTEGHEIRKTRPCLVVSPPDIHDHLSLVLAIPMTTGSAPAPYRIPIRFRGKHGLILLEQIRVLDRRRLVQRLGAVRKLTLLAVLATLQEMFAP
jgi:mRNA interferase MazF